MMVSSLLSIPQYFQSCFRLSLNYYVLKSSILSSGKLQLLRGYRFVTKLFPELKMIYLKIAPGASEI